MPEPDEAVHIAETESIFREVNERIVESADRFQLPELTLVCECRDPACTDRVSATLPEYENAREDGATFLLAPGHEDERVEAVLEQREGHALVEKQHPLVVPHVRRLDPRATRQGAGAPPRLSRGR